MSSTDIEIDSGNIRPSERDIRRADEVQQDVIAGRTRGLGDQVNSWRLKALGVVAGVTNLVAVACSPDVPGVGGNKPIQLSGNPSSDATAEAVNRESAINEAKAKAEAAAKAEADAKAAAGASKTSTPETKKESISGILSPEAEATGVYVQWKLPSGRIAKGMAFTLKKDDPVRIHRDLQVAGGENTAYNGFGVTAVTNGQRYGLIGDIIPATEKKEGDEKEYPVIDKVGKDLKASKIVAVGAGSGKRVFADADFNFIILYPTEEELRTTFQIQTALTPFTVNLWDPNAQPSAGSTFFGIKPPQTGG